MLLLNVYPYIKHIVLWKERMKINRKKGFFSISAISEMFSIHQQTVRLYEKQGLINPKRSSGNTRLFSEEDVRRLEEVIHLTHELGINLAGVEMILKLKKQIQKMQTDMNKLFKQAQDQLDKESESSKQIVKSSVNKLMKMKKEKAPLVQALPKPKVHHIELQSDEESDSQSETWEINYEE